MRMKFVDTVCVYLGAERLARLDALMARSRRTRSDLAREAVDALIARYEARRRDEDGQAAVTG